MEIFWTEDIAGGICRLGEEESAHCVRVLRHRAGDRINIIDGHGTMYECTLVADSPKAAEALMRNRFFAVSMGPAEWRKLPAAPVRR